MTRRLWTDRAPRCIAAAFLLFQLTGCIGWANLRGTPPAPIPIGQHHLRVTLRDGSRLKLEEVRMVGDSLIGMGTLLTPSGWQPDRIALASRDIQSVEVARFSAGKTLLGLVVGVGGFFGVLSLLWTASPPFAF